MPAIEDSVVNQGVITIIKLNKNNITIGQTNVVNMRVACPFFRGRGTLIAHGQYSVRGICYNIFIRT